MAAGTALVTPLEEHDPRAPQVPRDLVAVGDHSGLTLDWEQDGLVDGWTVYCDQLDGSDTLCDYVTDPYHRFADLAPGEHHVGVVAWRDGVPSPGPGIFVYASVLELEDGQPNIPVVTNVTPETDALRAEWIAGECTVWDVQLLDDFGSEEQSLEEITEPHAVFTGLTSHTGYGIRVRAVAADGTRSPWSDFYWTCTD